MSEQEHAGDIQLLLMDCDGVLTDGRIYFSAGGEELKVFNVRDGQGLARWHATGRRSGIISGRGAAEILERRAAETGIGYVRVASTDKVADAEAIADDCGVTLAQAAFIGDDIGDITLLKKVGFPVAVSDASPELLSIAKYVTRARGGHGAVREFIDKLLGPHVS